MTHIPAPTVDVVDTTGAGDAFNAAYVTQLAEGRTALESAQFAVTAASFSVTRSEVIPSLPYLADLVGLSHPPTVTRTA